MAKTGPAPTKLKEYKYDKLGKHTKQTAEWMKRALDANEIYPANPNLAYYPLNLVMPTNNTVLFAIEGARYGTGDWEWKILCAITEP